MKNKLWEVTGSHRGLSDPEVWDQVEDQVEGQVRDQVWNRVRWQVALQVGDQVLDRCSKHFKERHDAKDH